MMEGYAPDDTLVFPGGNVKALGNGRIRAYAVLFGSKEQHDASPQKDFFTKHTDYCVDFSEKPKARVWFNHLMDPELKDYSFGNTALNVDDTGVWFEHQLNTRKAYERAVYALAEKNALGVSSGTASHVVARRDAGDGVHEVVRWPLGPDVSFTVTPAEPRIQVEALKSLTLGTLSAACKSLGVEIGQDEEGGADAPGSREDQTVSDADAKAARLQDLLGSIEAKVAALTSDGQAIMDGEAKLGADETPVKQTWLPTAKSQYSQDDSLGELSFEEHTSAALGAVKVWYSRLQAIGDLRAQKAGRVLSQMNRERLTAMCGQIEEAAVQMRRMLEETMPKTGMDDDMAKALDAICLDAIRHEVWLRTMQPAGA